MKRMVVSQEPNWDGGKEIWPEFGTPPIDWYGFKISWPKDMDINPVFVNQYSISSEEISTQYDQTGITVTLYLFGYRLNLKDAQCDEIELPDGHYIEYKLVEYRNKKLYTIHDLKQRESTTYSTLDEVDDSLPVSTLKNSELSLINTRKPVWKESDAMWPTLENKLMLFIGQATLLKNKVTQNHLTWSFSNYLFIGKTNNELVYKMVTQNNKYQSMDEHYDHENAE